MSNAAEYATRRLAKMYAALSSTNEAILRAKSPEQLYQMVCDAAVHGSQFTATTIFVPEPGELWVNVQGTAGSGSDTLRGMRISVDENLPQGKGLVGTAYRTRRPCVANDWLNDDRSLPWRQMAQQARLAAAAALPLLDGEHTIAVLIFYSSEKGEFDDEMVQLLQRLAQNISFALQKFQQEEERRAAVEALRASESRFRNLTELSSDWYWEQDTEFRFTRIEGQHAEGGESVPEGSGIGKCRWETGLIVVADGGWEAHRELLKRREPFRDIEMYRTLADGTRRYISISGGPMFDGDNRFVGYRGVGKGITARKVAEERIHYLATHDVLTALPNRAMFSQLLTLEIQSARRYKRSFAVLFIDLDRFKLINDTLGHEAGDALLQTISKRLTEALRTSDVVARLGGDEFVVLLREVNEPQQAAAVARKVLATAIKPMVIKDQECRVSASVGISMYPVDAEDERSLMKSADIAMYLAKEEGKNNYQFYSKDIKAQSLER